MPELLDPMSDLAYAALMFGKGCQLYVFSSLLRLCRCRAHSRCRFLIDSCGKKGAGKVDPSFRARICNNCLKDVYVEDSFRMGLPQS